MLDVLLACVAALGLAIVVSVEHANGMDAPPAESAETHVLAP